MTRIGVVTTSRADYGIYRPVLARLADDPDVDLRLYVSGGHLADGQGRTVDEIEADGYPIADRIPLPLDDDDPGDIAKATGAAVQGFAETYRGDRPDVLVVLGDRFEMFGAALAALPFKIPVAHIHGGELTRGAIDDALRHATTKLSHLHFATTETYARRIEQMGEGPDRVFVTGAPALDGIDDIDPPPWEEVARRHGVGAAAPLLVTYHPVTLEYETTSAQMDALLGALDQLGEPVVFTAPNHDTANRTIRSAIETYVDARENAWFVEHFGQPDYRAAMRGAKAMVGNSSSGIIEAASFGLPVVDVGDRQEGRLRPDNVVDVPCEEGAIVDALQTVLDPRFRDRLTDLENPYHRQGSADRIVRLLKKYAGQPDLVKKDFHDLDTDT